MVKVGSRERTLLPKEQIKSGQITVDIYVKVAERFDI